MCYMSETIDHTSQFAARNSRQFAKFWEGHGAQGVAPI